ncbi:MAG TPA: hypothetical protein VMF06_17985 [Candidatus Limnocylindria bacterium]|nr:hypothetical protein [Candidatus Limnocylindria bacterium]
MSIPHETDGRTEGVHLNVLGDNQMLKLSDAETAVRWRFLLS